MKSKSTKFVLGFHRLESRRLMAADLCNVAGDSNFDGLFDSSDFVQVFQAAKYESGQPATVEEGDWNGDGLFDSSDLVYAFQGGKFEQPLTECRVSDIVRYDRPSDGLFSSYFLELQPDGTGTIIPGSDIAYFVIDHNITSNDKGELTLTITTHVETKFVFTLESLNSTTIVDEWGNEWALSGE